MERKTLVLAAADLDAVLDPPACIAAVETAFRARGQGRGGPVAVAGLPADGGGFHVKAAAAPDGRYVVAKVNGNFPGNPERHGLPTIQGVAALFDGRTGCLLALLDSARLTALRTAAASAVALRALARPGARSLLLVGCGVQGRAHLDAVRSALPGVRVTLYDASPERARALARQAKTAGVDAVVAADLRAAARECDLIVTCTPSAVPILGPEDVMPGVTIAAVGADYEHKLEIAPELMRRARVVVDVLDQAAALGDLRGAIAAGLMTREDVHAELGEVLAGVRPGRSRPDEVFVFDSTGVAFQDVAAAAVAYQRARAEGRGLPVRLGE